MLDKEIILVGYSGHGFVLTEAAISTGMNVKYYAEKKEFSKNPYSLAYIGDERGEGFKGWDSEYGFILGIGDNKLRVNIGNYIRSKGEELFKVIHREASISKDVKIGEGVFIGRNTSVNPLAEIQDFCIINTGSIIEHECFIGTGAHIAPGAVLAGNVKIGANSFIGANAVIKEGITIGENVIVGAGSVVIKDIKDNKRVVGNPIREI